MGTSNYAIGMARLYWKGSAVSASTNELLRSVKAFNATFSLGNIVAAEISPSITYLAHFTSVKGDRKKDKEVAVTKSISIPFTFDEINSTNVNRFMYGSRVSTSAKYVVMGQTAVPAEGTAVLAFSTDVGNDFIYVVPKCALKAEGGIAFNAEDWMSAKFTLEVLYTTYNASGTSTSAPYGYLDFTAVATAYA